MDAALPPEASNRLLDMLRMTLGSVGTHGADTSIRVEAGDAST